MYTVRYATVFNGGRDTVEEPCRTEFEANRRAKYYLSDRNVLWVTVKKE